jgi:uncharacterized membrane protein HdeD (DUF308 family)
MARGFNPVKIIGILLFIAGVVVLAIGIYQFVEFHQSVGGKLAGGANKVIRAFGGSGKTAKGYQQPLILITGGLAAAAAGFVVYRKS